jgi:hypothetical protein
MAQRKDKEKPILSDEILKDYPKIQDRIKKYSRPRKNRADLIRVSIDDLLANMKKRDENLESKEIKNITSFIKDIPKDLSIGFLKIMAKSEQENIQSYFRQLSSSEELRKICEESFANIGSEQV